jgi:hypothetical protein
MFTWICPKCGGEVPPSYSECPKCSPRIAPASTAEPRLEPPPASPVPPQTVTPAPQPVISPPVAPPQRAQPLDVRDLLREPPPAPPVPARRPVSPTLVAICAAAGLVVLLGILYLYILPDRSEATQTQATSLQNAGGPGSSQAPHPLAKHLEVAGIRVTETSPLTARISFVVINHSAADLPDLKMNVTLRPSAGGNPVFDFPVDIPSIGPYESREMTSTVKTTLKPYEIPDWQMLRPEFRITSEQ